MSDSSLMKIRQSPSATSGSSSLASKIKGTTYTAFATKQQSTNCRTSKSWRAQLLYNFRKANHNITPRTMYNCTKIFYKKKTKKHTSLWLRCSIFCKVCKFFSVFANSEYFFSSGDCAIWLLSKSIYRCSFSIISL